jgi:hypothetical protein
MSDGGGNKARVDARKEYDVPRLILLSSTIFFLAAIIP